MKKLLFAIMFFALVLWIPVWGQQIIGSFPAMDGGFENQSGTLGNTLSPTVWSRQTGAGSIIKTPGGRSGPKYDSSTVAASTRLLQSPQDSIAANGPQPSTAYVIQFYYKTNATITNFQVGVSINGTSAPQYTTATALNSSGGVWTKYTNTVTTPTGTLTTAGIGIIRGSLLSAGGPLIADDFVIYPGSTSDDVAPDPATNPSLNAPTLTTLPISWTAPGTGVDGGGYLVVRGTTDPTTAPNINGIYAIGNTVASGQTVVYIGTSPSFTDTGLVASTTYYYRIYTVDKAFNYSTALTFNATTVTTEPTVASTMSFSTTTDSSIVVKFSGGNGANRIIVVRPTSDVTYIPSDGIAPAGVASNYTVASDQGSGNKIVYSNSGDSVIVTGLTSGTMYYFRVYEYNGTGGTCNYLTSSYGSGSKATTGAGAPTITVTGSLSAFGNQVINTNSSTQTYTVAGINLTSNIVITSPSHFGISTDNINFYTSLTLTQSGGSVPTTTIYARFSPTATGAYSDSILHASTGATSQKQGVSGNCIKAEPTLQATNVTFSNVGANAMTVRWSRPAGNDSCIVVAKTGSAVDGPPVDATPYTANAAFGSGAQIGTGNFVVFKGTDSTVSLTSLSGGTTYYLAVYEFNSSGGTSENYNTTLPATGSQTTGQASYVWSGGASASWAASGSWTPSRSPGPNDIITFSTPGTVTATNVPTDTIAQLILSNNTTVNLQTSSSNTLTISGGTGTDLDVPAGCSLNINSFSPLIILIGTGATGNITGTMAFSVEQHRLDAADASSVTFNTGAILTQGTGCTGSIFTTSGTANAIVFTNGSTFIQAAGANPFGLSEPNSKVVFQTGSLFKCQLTVPSFSGRTYANFEYDNSGICNGSGASALSINNLIVDQGTLNLNMTGAFSLKGNINVLNGATLNFRPATSARVTLNGSAQQSISNAGTLSFRDSCSLVIDNANGLVLNNSLVLLDTLFLTNGIIATGANTLTASGMVSRTSGYVTGNFKKPVAAGSNVPVTFESGANGSYTPCTVTFKTVTTPGNLACLISFNNAGFPDATEPGNTLKRYWTLTKDAACDFDTCSISLTYVSGDNNTNFTSVNEDTLKCGVHYYDTTKYKWDFFPITAHDSSANSVTFSKVAKSRLGGTVGKGVTGGDFVIGGSYQRIAGISWLGVDGDAGNTAPLAFGITSIYPNPASGRIAFALSLPQAGQVRLDIFNMLGQKIATAANGPYGAGRHQLGWGLRDAHGKEVSSGVYFYRLTAGAKTLTGRLTVLR